ncbi:cytochrome P450 [Planobispora siamensis]|uniref:Cytochrome P450 hydroxylase n=1 Tax=Planobispora siamensis TaxID=936338 RepID=A0A8J3SFI5_9ACTN|nr:cytochrome P450 [Planobispora siamensis]GIH93382.1 cytochrome P450 hydroxylase [Planobispora siamensis]
MTIVTELDLPEFDYSAPDLTGEVYHRRLAEAAGRGWLAQGPLSYVVLDRESGEFFLRSRAAAFPGRQIAELFGAVTGRLWEQIDANILNQGGERHRRLRALVGPAFTPRAADRWRPAMRGFLEELWDAKATSCEFVASVARPYPALTVAAVLGAPPQDAPRLHEWSNWVQRQFDVRALATELPRIERAVAEVYDYVEALLAERRAAPGHDLVSALLATEEQGDRLSHAECVNLVLNVLAGGVDTTQAQLSHALRLFAGHPGQWALLADDPGLAARAVQEVLRYEPITPFTARICVEDVEHRGVVFPAGTIVAICAERGNREIEAGEEFDVTAERDPRILTFGAGAHYCLGANLARAELEEALAFLAPRMPELALDGEVGFGGVEGIYGLQSLPLRWSEPYDRP